MVTLKETQTPAPTTDDAQSTTCLNPATGEVIGHSPLTSKSDAIAAINRARAAQPAWAARPVKERCAAIRRVRDLIVARADALAETISRDNGKTRVDAMAAEVLPAAMAANYYAKMAPKWLAPKRLAPGNVLLLNKRSRLVRAPFGVVGVISPWNYPFSIPFSEIVMGLLAGNGVVLKVATETQLVGRAIEALFVDAGVGDVFQHVNLPGRVAGDLFLESGIDKLFFTGSVPVGKKLMAKAAETLTPVSLELGGNDAMLVCEDADPFRAAVGATWAAFQNAGQTCAGVERIYVHTAIYDEFMRLFAERVRALRVGPEKDHGVDIGAITTSNQLKVVTAHLEEALSQGAKIFAQSEAPDAPGGRFHPPTILTEVNHEMLVMKEETFGPLVGVMRVKDMDEAVELANDSNLGLTGSVWSTDTKKADALARRIEAGVVTINDHVVSHGLPETPWGGFKESGIGRTHGEIGFSEMTEPQCIVHDSMPGVRKDMWWHPHGPDVYDGVKGAIAALYGASTGERTSGTRELLKLFGRTFKR